MAETYYTKNKAYMLSKANEYYEANKAARLAYQKQYQIARKAAGWKQPSRAKPPGTPRKPRPVKKLNAGLTSKERRLKKPKLIPEPRKAKYEFAEASFELSFA